MSEFSQNPQQGTPGAYFKVLGFLKRVRKAGKTNPKEWKDFRRELSGCALAPDLLNAIDFWTMENLESHDPGHVRPRVLHEYEERLIPVQSHDEYLEAVRYGMVSPIQGEQVIDELMEGGPQRVQPETMMDSLERKWTKNVRNYISSRLN